MPPTAPAVITSKQAQDHFNQMKMEHADMLQGMAQQSHRVQQYNQQKQAEYQQQEKEQNDYFQQNADREIKRMQVMKP